MDQILNIGQNLELSSAKGTVIVTHDNAIDFDISLTAFLLTEHEKVQGDSGIVFYNQPNGPLGMATFIPSYDLDGTKFHKIDFDFHKVPEGISKIAVTLTEGNDMGFSKVKNLKAVIQSNGTAIQVAASSFTTEKGIVVLELYKRNGKVKARSVWRGFDSGLSGLCKNFGVDVSEDEGKEKVTEINPSKSKEVNIPDKKVLGDGKVPVEKPEPPKSTISFEKVSGKINLTKSSKPVIIEKTPEITATVSWETGTDYDIYALVLTRDGRQIDVAMFGAGAVPPLQRYSNGAVEHMGDVGRTSAAVNREVVKIRLNENILAVVPVVYSAQSNGTGSFYRYRVSMSIDNHQGTSINISANNANNNDKIYTCVPGMLLNTAEGVLIKPLELYSRPDSERRPRLTFNSLGEVIVIMDDGPINDYK